jgi:hypothetical protein
VDEAVGEAVDEAVGGPGGAEASDLVKVVQMQEGRRRRRKRRSSRRSEAKSDR